MATQWVGTYRTRPTDRTGNTVNEGCNIPTFRGGHYTDKELIAKLDEALDDLSCTQCTFWACEGPTKPKPMCTCVKCRAMREIAMVKAALLLRRHRMPLFEDHSHDRLRQS